MNIRTGIVSGVLALSLCLTAASAQSNQKDMAKKAPAAKGAFVTHKYRNLFREAGYSQKEIDAEDQRRFPAVIPRPERRPAGLL